ncbi:MAG: hypothetical protein AMXMBFR64_32990 [Myxococcales bacterium]
MTQNLALGSLCALFLTACASSDDGTAPSGSDAGADAAAGELAGFELIVPQSLVEGRPFAMTVRAQSTLGGTLTTWSGNVALSASRGAIEPAQVSVSGGEVTVQATLSREGTVTITLTGGGTSSSATPDVSAMRWVRDPAQDAVAKAGGVGSWRYAGWRGASVATSDGGLVAAFATGATLTDGIGDVIGIATSPDGLTWTVDPEEPVLMPADFGANGLANPHLVRAPDGTWHLWLETLTGDAGSAVHGIRHATSTDGRHFTPSGCPLFGAQAFGDWTSAGVGAPAAISREDGSFALWFTAWHQEVDGLVTRIGRTEGLVGATCEASWTTASIVVERGAKQTWSSFRVSSPHVWQDANVWRMLYVGTSRIDSAPSLGYATSADGLAWEVSPSNPVLVHSLWDGQGVQSPSVAILGDTPALFFEGLAAIDKRSRLGRAVPEQAP